MRRKVVLPQPLDPTMLTNSDAWICSEIFESTRSDCLLPPENSLQIRLVSSFGCTFSPMSGFELEVSPGRNFPFDIFEQCDAYDARSRKHQHADEHRRYVEGLTRYRDQIA